MIGAFERLKRLPVDQQSGKHIWIHDPYYLFINLFVLSEASTQLKRGPQKMDLLSERTYRNTAWTVDWTPLEGTTLRRVRLCVVPPLICSSTYPRSGSIRFG